MFDVTSTLGTSLVVAVPASVVARAEPGGAKALRDAVAAEHRAAHPEYGDVSATFMYGLRQVPESSASAFGALSQWVAVTDTALRHRTFCWLMVALEPSVVPPGGVNPYARTAALLSIWPPDRSPRYLVYKWATKASAFGPVAGQLSREDTYSFVAFDRLAKASARFVTSGHLLR